ncbi:golgin subfamily A member 6-like protein 1 [Armigeres subalbatus]|uniref:golgin subfamily A member 6-like protein 1 n=1 Tax=Armigeres subalbatus TaxID=124917 RepID=UPI002ED43591
MAHRFPRADHLTNEEVDYELILRNREEETRSDLESKQRLLRNLFFDDVKEEREYGSKSTVDQVFDFILGKIGSIEKQLEKGPDDRCISRLKHYSLRVGRLQVRGPQGEQLKNRLEGEINGLLSKFSGKKTTEDRHLKKNTVNTETSNSSTDGKNVEKETGAESLEFMKQKKKNKQQEEEIGESVEKELRKQLEEQKAKTKSYESKILELQEKLDKFCKLVDNSSLEQGNAVKDVETYNNLISDSKRFTRMEPYQERQEQTRQDGLNNFEQSRYDRFNYRREEERQRGEGVNHTDGQQSYQMGRQGGRYASWQQSAQISEDEYEMNRWEDECPRRNTNPLYLEQRQRHGDILRSNVAQQPGRFQESYAEHYQANQHERCRIRTIEDEDEKVD